MQGFQMRYTCSGELQSKVVDFIMRNAKEYIIAREFATREHIQCYVVIDITKKSWVNKFNDKFRVKVDDKWVQLLGMRDKYVEPDKGRTREYVCKGEKHTVMPIILSKRGFTDDDIVTYHNDYWLHEGDFKEKEMLDSFKNKPIEFCDAPPTIVVPKVKKQKTPTFMQECRQALQDEYPEMEWDKKHRPIVFKKVMYLLGQGCRNLDHIIISRMTNGVLNSLIKDKKEWLQYWYMKAFQEDLLSDEAVVSLDENDIFTDSKFLY